MDTSLNSTNPTNTTNNFNPVDESKMDTTEVYNPLETPRSDEKDMMGLISTDKEETPNILGVSEDSAITNNVYDAENQKRKSNLETDESPEIKKIFHGSSDEKKIVNLRKNIRDVMDENQLDTNTLVAQREESERLARVAEQQKIIREYQRQTVVNKQFVRNQNRVLSLLQGCKTLVDIKDISEKSAVFGGDVSNLSEISDNESNSGMAPSEVTDNNDQNTTKNLHISDPKSEILPTSDVVTIEDSSSEDDCILLSDDEDLDDENENENEDDPHNSGLHVNDVYNVPDELGRVVINTGHPEGEEDIFVAPQIAKVIKPHQIGGVRFLFDNIIESTKRFKCSTGFGCILSHSMGLGKTLQLVCFCDIFLRHTTSKTVLCVMPINTLQNWVAEFNMWLPKVTADPGKVRPRTFDVFILNDQQKTLSARAKVILKWAEEGGVLLIGYELFRLLSQKLLPSRKRRTNKNYNSETYIAESDKHILEKINNALVKPGPDLVVCDEGHRIKNAHAGISVALKQIRTRRRIVLTGYPLQNNLLEYWCMVDFVRPNYLGTRTEFCNMFERPIQNGQCIDSTPEDIKLMRYRAHVLHSLLVGFVQRRSHIVLQQTLPQKLEYVVLTRMTYFQRQLYDTFMNDIVRTKIVPNPLKAFAVCCKIWNHPDVLYNFLKKRETDLDLEIDDGETSELVANTLTTKLTVDQDKDKEKPLIKHESKDMNFPDITKTSPSQFNFHKDNVTADNLNISKPSHSSWSHLGVENNSFTGRCDTMSTTQNFYPRSVDVPYSSDCNGNNYWSEQPTSFFGPQVSTNIDSATQPNFVGIVCKDLVEQSPHTSEVTNSSEIVDLDTKEIKTIETDIDMSQNPIMKNKSVSENQTSLNETKSGNMSDLNIDVNSAAAVMPSSQNLKSLNMIDKDSSRCKGDDRVMHDWAVELMKKYEPGQISNSPKMEVFFCILKESMKLGDRVLLFSQSLLTLNLIEHFLQANLLPNSDSYWTRNQSYFRLDGSTTSQERERLVNEFNTNTNVKLFLISTRAGSLGINLIGANRVIVFDASWNPCHDTQAVYRIYRYGQTKRCYVYRIVMDKCLEKKIYDRQIKKQGMSDRVVDECNPDAHLSLKDVSNLCHDYDDDEDKNKTDSTSFSQPLESFLDSIMQKLILQLKNCLSKEPFYHDSLLIDRKETKLSQAEKRQAHRGYEMEKKASIKQGINYSGNKIQYRVVQNDGSVIERPVASIRPMQTSKIQNQKKTLGLRSTRWIPADVWQRQGMTAQEMTLPLDVVIPTNSSDKSNIILKAGQRVMVLKSVKGIYMQLDNGKIIAIRTSKSNDTEKSHKNEVIDITSDGESISDTKDASKHMSDSNVLESPTKGFQNLIGKNRTHSDQLQNCDGSTQQNMPIHLQNENKTINQSSLFASNNMNFSSQTKDLSNMEKFNQSPDKMFMNLKSNAPCIENKNLKDVINDKNEMKPNVDNKKVLKYPNNCLMGNMMQSPSISPVFEATKTAHCMLNNTVTNSPHIQPKHNSRHPAAIDPAPNSIIQPKGDIKHNSECFHENVANNTKMGSDLKSYTNFRTNSDNTSDLSEPVCLSKHREDQRLRPFLPPISAQHKIPNEAPSPYSNIQKNIATEDLRMTNSRFPNREEIKYPDHHNVGNIPVNYDYPTQISDYNTYGSYNYPHYPSYFSSNAYGNALSTQMGSNSLHMHWPPYINPPITNEQCNTLYQSNFSSNDTQNNEYHQ